MTKQAFGITPPPPTKRAFSLAFSLVELSIVLVILGLLTGGILAGQSLIRAAELRAVTTEYSRYVTATQSFRDKYFALPGDMRNATQFWGRLNTNADCVMNTSTTVTTPGACDGNGDGIINYSASPAQAGEQAEFWLHLANAGLIEGAYSGISAASSGPYRCVIGTDCPRSKLASAGWSIGYQGKYAGDASNYALDYGNLFTFGSAGANSTYGKALKPEEAWNIDTKMDDGKPAYGKIIAIYWNNVCATGGASQTDLANSVYNLSVSTIQCGLYFIKQF